MLVVRTVVTPITYVESPQFVFVMQWKSFLYFLPILFVLFYGITVKVAEASLLDDENTEILMCVSLDI